MVVLLLINYRLTSVRSSNPVLGLEPSMRRQIAGPMRAPVQNHDGAARLCKVPPRLATACLRARKRDAEPPATLDTLEKQSDDAGHL